MAVPVDLTGDKGLGPLSLGLTWTFTVVAMLVVVARFVVRRRTDKRWSIDDWLMLLALVVQVVYQALFTVMVGWGEALPFDRITALQRMMTSKWGWITAIPSILTSAIARISIAILLVRIFGIRPWFKWYMILFTSLLAFMSALSIIFLAAQCTPWNGLWDKSIAPRCWNPFIYAYTALATQFLYAISDLTFVLFPVLIIWRLNMPRRHKILLVILMALSLVTMGVVLTKIVVVLLRLTTPSAATSTLARYYQTLTNLVACLEQSFVITMGCIPSLKLSTRFKLPTFTEMGSWVVSLVSNAISSRSRQGSSYNSGDDSHYQDLELAHKDRVSDEQSGGRPFRGDVAGEGLGRTR